MTRSLPFSVEPIAAFHEIGNDETGKLKFRKQRGISIAERLAVKQVDQSDQLFLEKAELCTRIQGDAIKLIDEGDTSEFAKACSGRLTPIYLALEAALEQLVQTGHPQGDAISTELALRYPAELQQLRTRKVEVSDALIVRKATTMIRTRLDRTTTDWTDEDTIGMANEWLIVQIALFYGAELQGADADGSGLDMTEQLKQLEDALGKLHGESGELPSNPTGESSTGSAGPPTPALPSSAPTASGFNPSSTSSKPQTRRTKGS